MQQNHATDIDNNIVVRNALRALVCGEVVAQNTVNQGNVSTDTVAAHSARYQIQIEWAMDPAVQVINHTMQDHCDD